MVCCFGLRDLHVCSNRERLISYTQPTMALDAPGNRTRGGQSSRYADLPLYRPGYPAQSLRNAGAVARRRAAGCDHSRPQRRSLHDSAGMGAIINHYVHCQNKGVQLIVAGVNSRVMELFKMTKVDTVIALAGTVEEAEG
jgi:hypothetical protein